MAKAHSYDPDLDPKAEPLVKACARGDLGKVRSLVSAGIPVNAIGSKHTGQYPLHAAAKAGHDRVVSYLLGAGARVDVRTKAMLEQNADTPLLLALSQGHVRTAKILIEHGADVNANSWQKSTPIGRAIQLRSSEMVQYLVEHGARIESATLRLAARQGDVRIMQYLLRQGFKVAYGDDERLGTLLYCAIACNQIQMVKLLVQSGADVDETSGSFAETPLIKACSERKWEIANWLLQNGADPNIGSKHNAFPLNYAARLGGLETARLLLKAGAKVEFVDFEGMTPLDWAIQSRNKEMFQVLMGAGTQVPKELMAKVKRRFGKDVLKRIGRSISARIPL
jgi:ankyrin repeat protein